MASSNAVNASSANSSDPFQPFRAIGTMSISHGGIEHPFQIIRDTASTQSTLLKSALPGIENCYTGEQVYLQDFQSPFPFRLARAHLNSDVVKGEVIVGLVKSHPYPFPMQTSCFLMIWLCDFWNQLYLLVPGLIGFSLSWCRV